MANRKLSPLMLLVLDECQKARADEAVATEQIVDQFASQNGGNLNSAKASISRTLRRMWKRGLVELYDADPAGELLSLSQVKADATNRLAQIEADAERYFRIARNASGQNSLWRSPDAMLDDYRRFYGGDVPRGFRTRYVSLVPR